VRTAIVDPAGVAIRALRPDDAVRLAMLSTALGSESLDDWPAWLRRRDTIVVGAEDHGELVAYAAGDVRLSLGGDGLEGWLDAFGVALAYRGRGVGQAMGAELLARLRERGATRVRAVVPLHDQAITPFLQHLGFRASPATCLVRDL
jgi:GNAT superfamily N-acetyltransferase